MGSGCDDAGEVMVGECGASGSGDVGEARLVGGDSVGVPLDDPRCCGGPYPGGGFGYAVEGVGFVVEAGGAGVDIFGVLRVGVGG